VPNAILSSTHRRVIRCFACLFSFAVGASAAGADIPAQARRVLEVRKIPLDSLGLWIQEVGSDEPMVAHGAGRAFNPASAIKLLTTWAALEVLGPAYTWKTEVYGNGTLSDGILDGDLILKGYGDPYLTSEAFWRMLGALRRAGLREITQDLVIDDSYFAVPPEDPGAFDSQPFRSYNVAPNALLVNFKTVRFEFFANGGDLRVGMDPQLKNLVVRNRLKLADGRCRGYQAGVSFDIPDRQTLSRVVLAGNFPAACAPYSMSRTVLRHHTYALGLFETLWAQMGGRFAGRVRKDLAPENAEPILAVGSKPLGEIIRSINKYSNNVMTRQLLYTLGAEAFGSPATPEHGRQAIVDFLATRGLPSDGLVIDNGAGLSRQTRITAELLGGVLSQAFASPFMAEYVASLSLPGLDGTTRRRFRGRPEVGQMHLKTGRIDHVAAIAGFVQGNSGRRFVVVALLNHTDVHRGPGEEFQNALLRWLTAQ
jgi:D-alanyl-D-alanine carboxypeptidase/D-alanyl-D-alanine-endopeptidase (penicillin-binding protein 4)